MPSRLATSMIAAGRLPHLPHGPRRPGHPLDVQRLDRVDHAGVGSLRLERREHGLDRGLGQDRHRQRVVAQPLGPQPHLGGRLLAGDVEDAPPGGAEVAERHPGERALADSRRAAEQDQRARHEPAAQHPIELGDPGEQAIDGRRLHLAQRDRAGAPDARRALEPLRRTSRRPRPPPGRRPKRLDQGVPLAAAGAATGPGQAPRGRTPDRRSWESRRVTSLRLGTRPDAFAPRRSRARVAMLYGPGASQVIANSGLVAIVLLITASGLPLPWCGLTST